MAGYAKLHSSMLASSIITADPATFKVWICLLASADAKGIVLGSEVGLAQMFGVTIDEMEKALNSFTSPDKYSRTKDHEGRRIEVIDGGWHLLNYEKYRSIGQSKAKTEAERQRDCRARKKEQK